ncbi:MAG: sigma-70 family RNA polymerase sigma factor, partial [Deltaproteobacteria bacterium]|nr:sigma-70 family RNA polymerase sigma factor [Deltaproteobacteria bacterium]
MPEITDPVNTSNPIIRDDDAGFVARCRKGDTEAFSHLVRRHQKKMLNIAFRMIGDYDEACDVVQEAFLSAFRAIGKFQEKSLFSTWLCRIVLNHSKSHLKQKVSRSRREGPLPDDRFQFENGNIWNGPCAQEVSVVERIEKRELEATIQECIGSLDDEQREVLVLRDIQ